jgi:hypothetical protein
MDDRRAHFLTMVGDVCVAAGVAGITVELLLSDGRRVTGVPSPQAPDNESRPVGDTGYSSLLVVDGSPTRLEDVVEFLIHSP